MLKKRKQRMRFLPLNVRYAAGTASWQTDYIPGALGYSASSPATVLTLISIPVATAAS